MMFWEQDGWLEQHEELEGAIHDRMSMGLVPVGPLTLEQQTGVEAYETYQLEQEAEYEASEAAGGRTICPDCGHRSVTHRAVYTLGYAGHPGAEQSNFAQCERAECNYQEV